jgi:hypothetical protein
MYRAHRFQVVPAWSPDEHKQWKRPKLKEWREIQNELIPQADFDRIWAQNATRRNMGLITGPCSDNQFIIDLDTQKTTSANEWWNGLLAVHNNNLPIETVEQRTGGGGRQLLFRAPAGVVVPTCKTARGVDIRGHGGFAMLPPSMHESGRAYEWLPGQAPDEIDVALAPAWLLEAIAELVREHGGAAGQSFGREGGFTARPAVDPAIALDAFGNVVDGREQVMRDVVWHAVLELRRTAPMRPHEDRWPALAEAAYEEYERKVDTRISGVPKREGLERENPPRGHTLFWQKFRATMGRWDDADFVEEAKKPAPEGDGPGRASEPPRDTGVNNAEIDARAIPLVSAFPIDEAHLPVRDWSVPGLLLKRNLTVLVAPPGSGKSLLTLQWSIAVALGMEWGGWSPRKPEKVLIVNIEDDIDEMRRRLVAAARTMGVDPAGLEGRILLIDNPESVVIARTDSRTKTVIRTPLVEKLIATILAEDIGVVVADPFAETFEGDENSNSEVKWAGILWREVARRARCCLLLVHHTKKYAGGMAGEADASRGGGALIGTARIMSTLFMMTEDEASAMNVPPEDRTRYVRFDDAKANQSRLGVVRWFEKQTVMLNNGNGFLPGDEVGVLVPWNPPGALDGVSMHDLGRVLDAIDRGIINENGPTGQFYSASGTADEKSRWAGRVMMDLLGCSSVVARSLIKDWLKNEVLETFDYLDPAQRRSRKGVKSVPKNRPDAAPQYERM